VPGGGGWGRIGGASVEGSSPLSTALTSVTRVTRRDWSHYLFIGLHTFYIHRIAFVTREPASGFASRPKRSERPLADRV
jgi:hypothetical protein